MSNRSMILFCITSATLALVPAPCYAEGADKQLWTALKANLLDLPYMKRTRLKKIFAKIPNTECVLRPPLEKSRTKPVGRAHKIFGFFPNTIGRGGEALIVKNSNLVFEFYFGGRAGTVTLFDCRNKPCNTKSPGPLIDPASEQGSKWYRFRANFDRFIGMSRSDLRLAMADIPEVHRDGEERYMLPGAEVRFSFSGDLVDGFTLNCQGFPFDPQLVECVFH